MLFPVGDMDEMVRAMNYLVADGAKCETMGSAARRLLVEKFTVQQMVDGYETAFFEIIKGSAASQLDSTGLSRS
jgi:glycosyltransferase involved in cell wall biosynthesis